MRFLVLATLLAAAAKPFSCRNSQNAAQASQPPAPSGPNTTFRLVVSFYSKGEGIDYKMRQKFEGFMADALETRKLNLNPLSVPWGREGEVDFCLMLNELTPRQQKDLVAEIKSMMKGHELVRVSENSRCDNLR
jgi:hypothetical protein